MKKMVIVAFAGALMGACTTVEQRAVGGGVLGAGTGAVVGGLATGTTQGALAGAAIGGAGGAILGAATTPQPQRGYWCAGYDEFGNPVRYAC